MSDIKKKVCPLMTAALLGGLVGRTDKEISINDSAEAGKDTPRCYGEDCQLWWFCSGEFFKKETFNVEARVQNNY